MHVGNDTIPLMSEDLPQPTAPEPSSQWQYNPQDDQDPSSSNAQPQSQQAQYSNDQPNMLQSEPDDEPERNVEWSAAEFIVHHKDMRWYLSVIGIAVLLAVIVRLLTHDNITTVMLIIIGIFICLTAARKPRTLAYSISDDGLSIGERFMPYSEFRSFSVIHDGAFTNIEFMPLKRFMPMTSIYCSPDIEDDAIDLLSDFLPYEERAHSLVDRFARRIRF
jgi:hypothetical protein